MYQARQQALTEYQRQTELTQLKTLLKKYPEYLPPVEDTAHMKADIALLEEQLDNISVAYNEIMCLLKEHDIDFSGELGFSAKYAIERLLRAYHAKHGEPVETALQVIAQEPVAEVIQVNHGRYVTLTLLGAEPLEVGEKLYKLQ